MSIDSIKMTEAYTHDGSQIVPVAIVETTEESNAIDRPSISDDWKSINKVKKQYQSEVHTTKVACFLWLHLGARW